MALALVLAEPDVGELLRIVFQELLQVCVVQSSEELVRLARERQPQVLLLDTATQELNGLQAIKRLKADPLTRDIPVVALTVRGEERLAREAGADTYLSWPFDLDQLKAKLQPYL